MSMLALKIVDAYLFIKVRNIVSIGLTRELRTR